MDNIDRKILDLLYRDTTLSISEIVEWVGLSHTPCWKWIMRLEGECVFMGLGMLLASRYLCLVHTVVLYV